MEEKQVAAAVFSDPMRYGVELPLRAVYYPLGFPLDLATNSRDILAAADASWSRFAQKFDETPVRVRVAVEEDAGGEHPSNPAFRGQEHLMAIIADPANFAVCDYRRSFAYCWLTPAAARDRAYVCYHFLEAIAYTVLTQLYLTPVHAACVARNGRGVLLWGESGAGKSSLSYACARQGWTLLSDNGSYLVRRGENRVVLGDPHQIRFRPTAAELFPELNGRLAASRANDKLSIVLETRELPGIATAFECRPDFLVFLDRQAPGPAGLIPIPQQEGWRRLTESMPLYEKRVMQEQLASLRCLAELEVFELRYRDPDTAIYHLEKLVAGC